MVNLLNENQPIETNKKGKKEKEKIGWLWTGCYQDILISVFFFRKAVLFLSYRPRSQNISLFYSNFAPTFKASFHMISCFSDLTNRSYSRKNTLWKHPLQQRKFLSFISVQRIENPTIRPELTEPAKEPVSFQDCIFPVVISGDFG